MYYGALFVSVAANAVSLILLKRVAVGDGRDPVASEGKGVVLKHLFNPELVSAVVLYGFAAVAWMVALFGVDLIVAYPTLAVTYVVIGLLAPRLFAEEITGNKWVGIATISIGVVVLNL